MQVVGAEAGVGGGVGEPDDAPGGVPGDGDRRGQLGPAVGRAPTPVEIEDLDVDSVGAFFAFEGARSGLLGDEDVEEAAGAMEPGTVAALIVYENLWAIPFVAATLRAGGQMIASQRIPALDVMAALDAIEAAG